jgi:post-segregation antitoxin (ccd killing protein)
MKSRALNIKVPTDLYDALQKEAARLNISQAALVRMICSEYFDKKR